MRRKLRLGAIIGALTLALPAVSSAQTVILVNSSADPTSSGNCTLRDAILIANNKEPPFGESCQSTGDETVYEITFANSLSGGEIDLASPLPTITVPVNLTINGPQNPLYINSLGRNQILSIANRTATVLLENLVITGGASTGNGGGINNIGALTIRNCTFFSDEAQNNGGAIYNTGTLSAMNSTFYNDVALLGSGGALYNAGELILTNDTFYNDTAQDGEGGAIYNGNELAVASSTFDQDGASAGGGAAIFEDKTAIVASVRNTILVGSTGGGNCGGVAIETSFGGDFADDSSCNIPADDIVANAGVVLAGTPSQNGGPTLTIALQADGPAVAIIPFGNCIYPASLGLNPCTGHAATEPYQLTCDQRGEPRPAPAEGPDGNCDSGAYEYQAPAPTLGGGPPPKPSAQLTLSSTLGIFLLRGATQTFRVANRNSVAVPVTVTATPLVDFQIISDTCGSQVAARSSCSVTVRFEANQISLDTGRLTVSDGAAARASDALLIGSAL
jgi:hypothetical protein